MQKSVLEQNRLASWIDTQTQSWSDFQTFVELQGEITHHKAEQGAYFSQGMIAWLVQIQSWTEKSPVHHFWRFDQANHDPYLLNNVEILIKAPQSLEFDIWVKADVPAGQFPLQSQKSSQGRIYRLAKKVPASLVKHNHSDSSVLPIKISDEITKTNRLDNTTKTEMKSDFWACLDNQDQAVRLRESDVLSHSVLVLKYQDPVRYSPFWDLRK